MDYAEENLLLWAEAILKKHIGEYKWVYSVFQ